VAQLTKPETKKSPLFKKFKRVVEVEKQYDLEKIAQSVHPSIVLLDLKRGGLDSLSRYLERNAGIPDAEIAQALQDLISGGPGATQFRLIAIRHPDLPARKRGRKKKPYVPTEREFLISEAVCGLLLDGVDEASAVAEVAAESKFGKPGQSTVRRIRRNVTDFLDQSYEAERLRADLDKDLALGRARREIALANLRDKARGHDSH
jgi:hypothetical protein